MGARLPGRQLPVVGPPQPQRDDAVRRRVDGLDPHVRLDVLSPDDGTVFPPPHPGSRSVSGLRGLALSHRRRDEAHRQVVEAELVARAT